MRYCVNCGKEIEENAAFCAGCGAVAQPQAAQKALTQTEQAFLDTTHKLLRWEHKAWRIAGTVWVILGIVFAAIFFLLALAGAALMDYEPTLAEFYIAFGIMYAVIFGSMYIAIGIVNKKAAAKLPQYIDTVYTDFSISDKRCGSVGMLVFTVLFGVVSPIFFIINFARMKACRATIESIIQKQSA